MGEVERLTLADMMYHRQVVERMLRAILEDRKLRFSKQNLIFLNSHQAIAAYRYIGSPKADFALAEDMLRENPDFRLTDHISFA
jgi:hypothetical protein